MVLAAQKIGFEVAGGKLLHGRGVVGVILRILGDLLHDGLVAGEAAHDVRNGGGVVGAGRGADPCAAPVIRLRAFADGVIAVDAVARFGFAALGLGRFQGIAQQREIDAPGGIEEPEHLAVGALVRGPHVAPQAGFIVVAVVGVGLGLFHPLHQVFVHSYGGARHPWGGDVVGESAVAVVIAGQHLVALRGGLFGHSVEFVPIRQGLLHLSGVVGAQYVFGDAAPVGEQAGGGLPGDALQLAAGRGDVLGVRVLPGQVCVRQADIAAYVQRVVGIHILQRVIRFDEENIDLVVGCGGILRQQGLVQLVLVIVVLVGIDGPLDDRAVVERGGGFVLRHFLYLGIIVVEPALELVVPAPDVEHGAIGGRGFAAG